MSTLEVSYRKTLGLPNYSSHCCTASVRVEIENVGEAQGQITLLYGLLQGSVDSELATRVGFVPQDKSYGKTAPVEVAKPPVRTSEWACGDILGPLIVNLTRKLALSKNAVNDLAKEHFKEGVRELNARQATTFIKLLRSMIPPKKD